MEDDSMSQKSRKRTTRIICFVLAGLMVASIAVLAVQMLTMLL